MTIGDIFRLLYLNTSFLINLNNHNFNYSHIIHRGTYTIFTLIIFNLNSKFNNELNTKRLNRTNRTDN